jgi:hypothetical protein
MTPASIFAGDDVFGSAKREITESKIDSTVCVGFHLSEAVSPESGSSPGGCKIEMHNLPSGYIFGLELKMK